jgi:hypothetical protein
MMNNVLSYSSSLVRKLWKLINFSLPPPPSSTTPSHQLYPFVWDRFATISFCAPCSVSTRQIVSGPGPGVVSVGGWISALLQPSLIYTKFRYTVQPSGWVLFKQYKFMLSTKKELESEVARVLFTSVVTAKKH